MQQRKPSTNARAGVLHLTVEDVQKLLTADAGAQSRIGVTERVADHYSAEGYYDPMESVIAEQIFRLLVRDTEVQVRTMMADRLKASKTIPHDIVMVMAKDVEDAVALPILKYSEVLSEADLIALVNASPATARHVAVSERREVPGALAGALLSKKTPEVAQALLNNHGAELDEQALCGLLERYGKQRGIMDVLARRSSLPLAVAERVVTLVSSAVAEGLRRKYRISGEELELEAQKAREQSTLELLRGHATRHEVEKLVEQLALFERLTPTLIFTALCQGHILFFEMSLARLGGIPLENVQKLLSDRGGLGFRAVYNKSGLPSGMFNVLKQLLGVAHQLMDAGETKRGEEFAHRLAEQLILNAQSTSIDNLDYIVALVRNGMR